jgi:hypothetical protein
MLFKTAKELDSSEGTVELVSGMAFAFRVIAIANFL